VIPVTPEERTRYSGLWSEAETLSSLLAKAARLRPAADAVVDAQGARLTYAELDAQATALATSLSDRGIGLGDAIGVQLPNRAESSVIVAAIEKLGAVTVPLTPMFREHELSYMGRKTRMAALFVPGTFRGCNYESMAISVRAGMPSLQHIISLANTPAAGVESLRTLTDRDVRAGGPFEDPTIDPNAIAAILFTSGTESDPKAVIHTNNTLLANNRCLATMLGLSHVDHVFMASPVGHGTGFGFGTRLAIYLGSKLVLLDIWDAAHAAFLMASERCAYTHASTTFAQDLLEFEDIRRYDLSALRYFVSGGAAVPPGFANRMRERIGCQLLRLYGQTEAFMTTLNRPTDSGDILDSRDGRAVAGVELCVLGDDDTVLGYGQVGELACRGPHRCRGFLGDPERTAKAIRADGWMRMGDLGVLDEDGYVHIVGRTKEIISRGGYKFSPREVEEMLLEHPDVDRVAVVGLPDRRLGERACACVIPRPDSRPGLADLVGFLRQRGLAPYKLPEHLELMAEFPLTPSGKIKKFVLEKMVAERVLWNRSDDARSPPSPALSADATGSTMSVRSQCRVEKR
jgi:acyl-CoA synthetase (AMP-forming)/AMP-acid ligase II